MIPKQFQSLFDKHSKRLEKKFKPIERNRRKGANILKSNVITSIPPEGISIKSPGTYTFANNITWRPKGDADAITITSNDVVLDFKNFILTCRPNENDFFNAGVAIFTSTNVTIQNGSLRNFSFQGIYAETSREIVVDSITIDGLTNEYYDEIVSGIAFNICDSCKIMNVIVKNISCYGIVLSGIDLQFTTNTEISNSKFINLYNKDGVCAAIRPTLCNFIKVNDILVDKLKTDFVGLSTKSIGHTCIGLYMITCENIEVSSSIFRNIQGCCDDAHGLSVFISSKVKITKCQANNISAGLGYGKCAKTTGFEVYGSDVTVEDSSVKNVFAINPQDKQCTGFSAADGGNVQFLKCVANVVNVYNEKGEQSECIGYGIGFGWAPDARQAFIKPIFSATTRDCTSKNCQVGYDSFFYINSTWTNISSICNGIAVLNNNNSSRTVSCDQCSECPEPISTTIKNVSKNNTFVNVKINYNCATAENVAKILADNISNINKLYKNKPQGINDCDCVSVWKSKMPFGHSDHHDHQQKVQVLTKTEPLDPEADVYVVDIQHHHDPAMGKHCNQFYLPNGKVGQTKLIYCKNLKHVVFYTENLYNNISELHFRYPNQGAYIQYQEIDGWTLLGFTQNTGMNVPKLISYNGQKPFYIYVLCTTRRMPMYNSEGQLVPQPVNGKWRRDYVTVIDLNPMNATYGQIVERIYTNPDTIEPDELHHGHLTNNSNFIIAPGLSSSAINVIDLRISERHPVLKRRIPSTDIWATGLSNLHTVLESELWGNDIIISSLSVANNTTPEGPRGNGGKGGFILLNNGFENTEEFPKSVNPFINFEGFESVNYNYDFQLKECYEIMTSTEWTHYGTEYGFDAGFFNPTVNPVDVDRYGHKVHVWDLVNKNLIQTLDLRNTFLADNFGAPRDVHVDVPNSGEVPLEIRFLNKEMARIAIIGCVCGLKLDPSNPDSGLALNGGVLVALYCPPDKDPKGPNWFAKQVAFIPNEYDWLPAITDITLSKDEKCLYVSCWLTGRLIQFDLSKVQDVIDGTLPELPILSSVILGGEPDRPDAPNNYKEIKGKLINGGPQMLRLTPNGRDLYVTNSLYSSWDEQFYPVGSPKTIQTGSWLIKVNTGIENGVKVADMTVDERVFIDFGGEPDGPTRAHECHMKGTTH